MWRNIIFAMGAMALLTSPVSAQSLSLFPQPGDRRLTPEELQQRKVLEQEYNAATRKIPDKQPSSNDPWGKIRSNASKSATARGH
jgi:hypothetical protein